MLGHLSYDSSITTTNNKNLKMTNGIYNKTNNSNFRVTSNNLWVIGNTTLIFFFSDFIVSTFSGLWSTDDDKSNEIIILISNQSTCFFERDLKTPNRPTIIISLKNQIKVLSNREKDQKFSINILMKSR